MVASLAQAASAAYYLESQRSFRHPNEYYTAGEEPDGVWFNPKGLLGLDDGGKVDSGDFHRLYHGFAPDGSGRLTRNAGSERRSPGLDMTFSADKSVSALWAIADPELRRGIEQAHNDAARVALEETVFRYCAYTRIRNAEGHIEVRPADIAVAMFQHGTSRDNDPQLHTHSVIFNAARTHEDGKWRALHQHPVYGWVKAAGAVYRNTLAWNLHDRLGIRMEQYGRDGEFTRVAGMPADLEAQWSKRRAAIVDAAKEMGFSVEGNAARAAAANKVTRAGKSPDNDPEVRHRRWQGEAENFVQREELIAELPGKAEDITQERLRELTDTLEALPERLTREEAVFRLPDVVERVGNATAGLMGRDAIATSIERVLRHPEVVRLTRVPRSAEGRADMAHTRLFSTGRTLRMEQALREMAADMTAETGHALPAQAIETKVETLIEQGYPLSEEQTEAIRAAAGAGGRVAIVEGAAGSGKTTTLRPIADLHREHGGTVIATAVAWRTAVALGNDLDARPFCVDKLLKLAAKDRIGIDRNTVIVVDEAGMLSTRQAHHVLRLAERHGAKVVFAGDTRQQQPVEAGPGLRLIRDAVGSVRVDRIRRQKPDLEDILVHVHGETPAAARFRGGLMGDDERANIVADYDAMTDKPAFRPWQVAVSEALRDGDAAAAIEAWHERGRLHLGYSGERTLTALVDDWDRFDRRHPGKTSVVLARTRAEVRVLSHLMRERRFARQGAGDGADTERVTVTVSRGTEDDRTASALEIAVGDRLRIGATHWEKQLFNGTIVTVEDIKVTRRAGTEPDVDGRGPQGRGPEGPGEARERPVDDPSVLISARTCDGRRVQFRHDEIRDWYGNVRLDHGYALTVAAAQGLTVDRTFLLADDRPSRETVYPAATRHREEIDIYVNRAPLALDVADRRADSDREAPVLDSEIRAYLAERWSRSRPKEAALDYLGDGEWEDLDEDVRERRRAAGRGPGGAGDGHTGESRTTANDNALSRIAHDIQRTTFAWRHGAAVDAFTAGRREVLASWDALRERTRAEGDAVALTPAYRETLGRHAALLRQAEPFRARPDSFAPLLAERGDIRRDDLDAFEALHERARRHRRAAVMRRSHRTRREAERHDPETRRDVRPAHEGTVQAASLVPPAYMESVPPPTGEDRAEALAEAAWQAREDDTPEPDPEPRKPAWRADYDPAVRAWNALAARARQSDTIAFHMEGYAGLIPRIRALAEKTDIPADRRASLVTVLESHDRHLAARNRIGDFIASAGRLMEARAGLEEAAPDAGAAVAEAPDYPDWREEAERLKEEGEAILADRAACGPHLDNAAGGRGRVEEAVSGLGDAIREDDEALAARRDRELRRQRMRGMAGPRFASVAEIPGPAAAEGSAPVRAALSRLGRGVAGLVGGAEYHDRMRSQTLARNALERAQALKREWNRLVDRAEDEGVHVLYSDGCGRLREGLRTVSSNMLLDRGVHREIEGLLKRVGEAAEDRRFAETWRDYLVRALNERAALQERAAERGAALPDHADYDSWRNIADYAVERAEEIMAHRGRHGIHLDCMALRGEGMEAALERLRGVLAADAPHLAASLAGRRKGENADKRKARIADLVDDPEKLDELRRRRAERRAARREAAERRSRGRYMSMRP